MQITKRINNVSIQLEKLNQTVSDIKNQIEELHDEMENYFDEKSEKWQESENGELFEEKKNLVAELLESLETIESEIENATGLTSDIINS